MRDFVFPVALSVIALLVITSFYSNLTMRVRLSLRDQSKNSLGWWIRGHSEVTDTYQSLYPRSLLPRLSNYAFWTFVAVAALLFVFVVLRRH
jgi:hypothetical protein